MKKKLLPCLFLFNFFIIANKQTSAQIPVFNSVTPNTTSPAKLDKFELNINLTAAFTNPYDYGDIDVSCIFSAPDGRKDTVDGFFMQDYTLNGDGSLTALGSGNFRVRYAPNEAGSWSYVLSCTNTLGTTTQPAQTFQCIASTALGFIRKNTTNYLGFDNGKQYFPIGEDMGWQDGGTANVVSSYTNWLTKLADNNGNFIRVWMSSWAFAFEWKNGSNGFSGLEKYKQSSGFYLDWLLDYCKQKGVYIMLALNNHGQVSTNVNPEWSDNPYNIANGGPAANTWDFFRNATAKALHKNRLRYIIARCGYSQNIQSWELFNEVEWTDQFDTYKTDVTAWHNEMAAYIKSKDVYKHLVTTSYAHDSNDPATWNLADIDFTQTHFYVNSPNIESVIAPAAQNYLSDYNKPTLNGEFGLGPAGATLSTEDPNGVHIHNAIWGTSFSGAMGSAMSWWWDDYIDPQNLYYHFKPLAAVTSLIKFKDDNYKKATATTSGGGAADVIVSPGANFGAPTSSSFTIDAAGSMSPGPGQLGQYLFGSVYNTQYHNPPVFNVTYPVNGKFIVTTGGSIGTAPQISIYVDGSLVLNANAAVNTAYSVNIAAGAHAIKVDNPGTDWTSISNYTFTNIGSPLASYVLKSADTYKAAGWLLNSKYNWQYLQGGSAPALVSGGSLNITGMHSGNYTISFYSTSTGNLLSTIAAVVSAGNLTISLPDILWDVAFTAVENSVLPVQFYSFSGIRNGNKNLLYINIANAENVKTISLERSSNNLQFKSLANVSDSWISFVGRHEYVDNTAARGDNYYRLKITDKDGKVSYSKVISIVNSVTMFQVYPNPVGNFISLNIDNGNYLTQITDHAGRVVLARSIVVTGNNSQIPASVLAHGIYYLSVYNIDNGEKVGDKKIIK